MNARDYRRRAGTTRANSDPITIYILYCIRVPIPTIRGDRDLPIPDRRRRRRRSRPTHAHNTIIYYIILYTFVCILVVNTVYDVIFV